MPLLKSYSAMMKEERSIDGLPTAEYFLFRLSHAFDVIQLFRVGLEKNPPLEPGYAFTYGRFMVHCWDLVWMGLLLLYGLALGSKRENGFT